MTIRYAVASILLGIGLSALFARAVTPTGADGLPSSLLVAGIVLAMVGAVLLWLPRG